MQDIDMSRPGSELFPETGPQNYNSYQDVMTDQVVDDPLNMGVKQAAVDATPQATMSDKEMNFRALREETAKLQAEREYWKGQAEAYQKMPSRQPEPAQSSETAFEALDFDDGEGVKKAFTMMRQENQRLRDEMRDSLAAAQAKAQYQDWNNMVTSHVPQLTSKNPIFAEMIQKASNPYEAAYLLAELNAKASQPVQNQPHPSQNAQRVVQNASKPQTLDSIGGRSTLSSADYYASMSDKDFMDLAARNMASI